MLELNKSQSFGWRLRHKLTALSLEKANQGSKQVQDHKQTAQAQKGMLWGAALNNMTENPITKPQNAWDKSWQLKGETIKSWSFEFSTFNNV